MRSISRTESPPDKPGRLIRRSIAGTPRLNTGLDNSTKKAKEMRHGAEGVAPGAARRCPRPRPRRPRPTGPAMPPRPPRPHAHPQPRPPAATAPPRRRASPRAAAAPGAGSECGGIQFTPGPSLPYTYTYTYTRTNPESRINGARETTRRTTAYRNYGKCAQKPRTPGPGPRRKPPTARRAPHRPRLPLPRPAPSAVTPTGWVPRCPRCVVRGVRRPRGHPGRACLKRSCRSTSWWGGWDSNPRPTDYESAALTG